MGGDLPLEGQFDGRGHGASGDEFAVMVARLSVYGPDKGQGPGEIDVYPGAGTWMWIKGNARRVSRTLTYSKWDANLQYEPFIRFENPSSEENHVVHI